jgi:acetyl esterase/lipase
MRVFLVGFLTLWAGSLAGGQEATKTGGGQSPPCTPAEAAKRVNEEVVVEMRVNSTGGVRNSYLNSASDFSQAANFAIFIPETARMQFAEAGIAKPDEHYYGKTIQVTGKVVLARDRPRIVVNEPGQIKVLEGQSGPAVRKRTHIYKQVGGLDVRADSYNFTDQARQPVIVWIHGGALISGHRESFPAWLMQAAREQGCALVSIDYRLAPETQLPEIIEDLEDAFRWIREKGPELFQADGTRVAAVGGSAGGYLALSAGQRVQPRLAAVVSLWGYGDLIGSWYSAPSPHPRHQQIKMPADEAWAQVSGEPVSDSRERRGNGGAFYQFCRQQGLWPKAVSGWDPKNEAEKFAPFMPVKNVTADYPPTLLIHGDRDTDVPHEQSEMMAAEFKRLGVQHRLISVAGAEHGLAGGGEQAVSDAYRAAREFLRERLRAR